jgi:hypothetical protein
MLKFFGTTNSIQTQTIVLGDKNNTCCFVKPSSSMKAYTYLHIIRKFNNECSLSLQIISSGH